MPPKKQAFSDLQWCQRQSIVQTIYEILAAHGPTAADVTNLLCAVLCLENRWRVSWRCGRVQDCVRVSVA